MRNLVFIFVFVVVGCKSGDNSKTDAGLVKIPSDASAVFVPGEADSSTEISDANVDSSTKSTYPQIYVDQKRQELHNHSVTKTGDECFYGFIHDFPHCDETGECKTFREITDLIYEDGELKHAYNSAMPEHETESSSHKNEEKVILNVLLHSEDVTLEVLFVESCE